MAIDRYQVHHQIITTQVHDMLLLMNSLSASIHLLQRTNKDEEGMKKELAYLKSTGQALATKIQAWSQYEQLPHSPRYLQVESITRKVTDFFSYEINKLGLEFNLQPTISNHSFKANPWDLCNMLILLIYSRIRAIMRYRSARLIELGFIKKGSLLIIRLTDKVPAIEAKEQPKVYKTNSDGNSIAFDELYLAKHLVERSLDGEFLVSGDEQGSQITIKLQLSWKR